MLCQLCPFSNAEDLPLGPLIVHFLETHREALAPDDPGVILGAALDVKLRADEGMTKENESVTLNVKEEPYVKMEVQDFVLDGNGCKEKGAEEVKVTLARPLEEVNHMNFAYTEENPGPNVRDNEVAKANFSRFRVQFQVAAGAERECPLCGRELATECKVLDHVKKVHFGIKTFFCYPCDRAFFKNR